MPWNWMSLSSDTRSLGNWKQTLWSTFRTASLTLLANKAWGVYFQFWGHTVVARLSNWFLVLVFIWSFPVKEVQFAFRDSLLNWISAVIDFSLMWFISDFWVVQRKVLLYLLSELKRRNFLVDLTVNFHNWYHTEKMGYNFILSHENSAWL